MRDFIFNAAGGIGGQLDVFVGLEGVDGFDQADGSDGDQVFYAHAGIVEFFAM